MLDPFLVLGAHFTTNNFFAFWRGAEEAVAYDAAKESSTHASLYILDTTKENHVTFTLMQPQHDLHLINSKNTILNFINFERTSYAGMVSFFFEFICLDLYISEFEI
ncbi:hypothetical protein ACJX0J_040129 [Zea mays]